MNEARVYEDNFRAVFTRQEDFLSCINRIGNNSFWERRKSKSLRLVAMTSDSKVAEEMREEYMRDGLDEQIITDTILNTGLLIRLKDKCYPVRACAIKSILDRAGISGSGLRRVDKSVYARILNDCLKVTNGEALVRISEGKVSAVLGGDCHDYAVLDTEQIFLHSVDYLNTHFKGCQYLGGFYEHDMVSALWELSGNDELLDAYRTELRLHGKEMEEMKPMVRITTSDTGMGGANIYPMLVSDKGRCTINLGSPLKLGHRNGSKISDFDEQLKMLYSKYQAATGNLIKLLDIEIMHPVMSQIDALIAEAQRELGILLAAKQVEAVRKAFCHLISIITGGPGTGKTTVQKVILYVNQKLGGDRVLLTAPTGRASRRMSESTGYPDAKTMHSAMGLNGDQDSEITCG